MNRGKNYCTQFNLYIVTLQQSHYSRMKEGQFYYIIPD